MPLTEDSVSSSGKLDNRAWNDGGSDDSIVCFLSSDIFVAAFIHFLCWVYAAFYGEAYAWMLRMKMDTTERQ